MPKTKKHTLKASITEEEATQLVMSICIRTDGLTFSISNENDEILKSEFCPYKKSSFLSFEEKLSELLYSIPLFTFSFKKLRINYIAYHFLLVPEGINIDKDASIWLNGTTLLDSSQEQYIGNTLFQKIPATAIYSWDTKVYHFLKRTYPLATFLSLQEEFLGLSLEAKRTTLKSKKLFFTYGKEKLILALFEKEKLLFFNQFSLSSNREEKGLLEEILFFLLSLYEQHKDIEAANIIFPTSLNSQEKEFANYLQSNLAQQLPFPIQ